MVSYDGPERSSAAAVETCCLCVKNVMVGSRIIAAIYLLWAVIGLANQANFFDPGCLTVSVVLIIAQVLLLVGLHRSQPGLLLAWLIIMGTL